MEVVDLVVGTEAQDFAETALDGVKVLGYGRGDEGEAVNDLVLGGAAADGRAALCKTKARVAGFYG